MPPYNTYPPAMLLHERPSNFIRVFQAEAITTGEFSQQFCVPFTKNPGQKGIRVDIDFSADPGNFEIDVMESSTDPNGVGGVGYQQVPTGGAITQANKTTGANGANTHCSTDLIPFAGEFGLLYVKTQPSNAAITCTARVSRAA